VRRCSTLALAAALLAAAACGAARGVATAAPIVPAGDLLAVDTTSHFLVLDGRGGVVRRLGVSPPGFVDGMALAPDRRRSPDGRRIAVVTWAFPTAGGSAIRLVSLAKAATVESQARALATSPTQPALAPAFLDAGTLVVDGNCSSRSSRTAARR
jgi:hypothetical protein